MRDSGSAVFAAVVGLAFVLRLAGVGFGLPHVYHQDEPILVNHAMSIGAGGWNTHFFVIPPFTVYFLFGLYGAFFLAGKAAGLFTDTAHFALSFVRDPSAFYLIGRFVLGVLFGTATVALVAKLGGRFFSKRTGLWAAVFLALCPLHVQHSHYLYADIPVTFAVTAFLFFLLAAMREPAVKNFVMAGLMLGWAVSVKYTAAYFVPVAALAAWFAGGFKKTAVLFVASAAVYTVVAPFTFLDWAEFYRQMLRQAGAEGPVGSAHHFSYSILQGTSWPFVLLAAAGAGHLWKARRREAALITGAALWFYIVNAKFSQPFARYMLPVIPVLSLLAGAGWEWASEKLARHKLEKGALLTLVAASLAAPSVYLDGLFLRKDTRTECLEWFHKNARPGAVVVVDNRFYAPRLAQTAGQIREKYTYLKDGPGDAVRRKRLDLALEAAKGQRAYQVYTLSARGEEGEIPFLFLKPFVRTEWSELKRVGAEYLVLNHSDVDPGIHEFKRRIAEELEAPVVFSPYRDPSQKRTKDPHGSTAAPHSLGELFSRTRPGPYLEVYKIKR
jgi:hypothetical protein